MHLCAYTSYTHARTLVSIDLHNENENLHPVSPSTLARVLLFRHNYTVSMSKADA
jgi:hypothetical protein